MPARLSKAPVGYVKFDGHRRVQGSGGIRVIYYWKNANHEIWMLTLYSKSEQSTLPGHLLKQIAEAIKYE